MQTKLKLAGVDGCRGGWVAAGDDGSVTLFPGFAELIDAMADATLYVDIPMGLPEERQRTLESKARKLLVGRSASVFSVPCRDAVYARDYQDACDINVSRFGKKLSKQTWNICGKIREADIALSQSNDLRQRVFESHPELVFQQLNGASLAFKKKTATGIEERLEILRGYLPGAHESFRQALVTYPSKLLARDDIVDAMALVVVGLLPQKVLTDEVGADERGIPIRMIVPYLTEFAIVGRLPW